MPTLLDEIINNLTNFFSFKDKIVLHVGAGGGQLLEYSKPTKHVYAIDIDDPALKSLKSNIKAKNLTGKFTIEKKDYYLLTDNFDVTFFEYCLHEMADPKRAFLHAKKYSKEILIIDHMPDSKWAWFVGETELAQKSWKAIDEMTIKKKLVVETEQTVSDFKQLENKLSICGHEVQDRISIFKNKSNITLPMRYGLVLL
jgi:2-polyprenyl-3-methyl-5-hydroxy-6-metoxy-1,4-benzoquinol methylase